MMVNYIIQVLLFQTLFLAVYDFVLKKETFFQWNRAYLIFTSILAYIIPLLKFKTVQENIPQEYIVMLPEVVLSPVTVIEKHIDWSVLLFIGLRWVFFAGMILASAVFIYKIVQLFKIVHQNRKEINKEYSLILLPDNGSAFSFFKYIFLGRETQQKQQIITHELVHVKQKHSIDLLIFEIQKIVFWFNPFSYLFQNRISEVHEFIADSKSISKNDKSTYFQGLLAQVFQIEKFAFVNSFYKKSLIKKRIIMLGKNKSKEILKLKYLFMIPLLMGMLIYTSCKPKHSIKNEDQFGVKKNKSNNEEVNIPLNEIALGKYFGISVIPITEGKVISYQSLTNEEKAEFDEWTKIKNEYTTYEIYQLSDGKKHINKIIDREKQKLIYTKAEEVPFAYINQVPIFPGCEDAENQKKCFMRNIQMHVARKYDTKLSNTLGLKPGNKRIFVQFIIDKKGEIVNIRARGPHKEMENEAIRVISELPSMQAGEHDGKKVSVKYTLPISLMVK